MQITWTNCAEQMPPDDEVIITECCNAQILRDQRYCPKCGYECRIHTRKMGVVEQMSQQCGKCKFWDKHAAVLHGFKEKASDCNAPIPASFVGKKQWMLESEGKNCPVYEERKECGGVQSWSVSVKL